MLRRFSQVDCFTNSACHGNPCAVVVDGDGLDDRRMQRVAHWTNLDRKSTRLNSSHPSKSYAVFCLKKKITGPVTHVIPADALYTDESRKEHGLKGEYFSNIELKDTPVMTRTDARVDFAWGDTGISNELPNNYSVRWTGILVPPVSGEYVVGFSGQDGHRMWLEGQLLGEDWNVHHPATVVTKAVKLEKDRAYAVKDR